MNSGSSALHLDGRAVGIDLDEFLVQPDVPTGNPVDGRARAPHDQHLLVALALLQGLIGILLERDRPAAAHALVGRDDELGVAVVDAPRDAVGRKAAEHHRMHRADAGAGQDSVGRLGDHRQIDRDPIALLDAVGFQHVGEFADALVQLAIGDLLVLGRIVALPDDGDLVGAGLQVAVDAVGADVERAVLVPLDRYVLGRVGGVLDLGVGLDPVDALAHLAPEQGRLVDRALVHCQVFVVVEEGPARPLGGDVIDLVGHCALPPTQRIWLALLSAPSRNGQPALRRMQGANPPAPAAARPPPAAVARLRRSRRPRRPPRRSSRRHL